MANEKESIWKVSDGSGQARSRKTYGLDTFKWDKTRSAKLFDSFEEILRPATDSGKKVRLTDKAEDLMTQFDAFAKDGTVVSIKFDTCDTVGNYTSMTDEGVLFLLPSDNFLRGGEFNKYGAPKVFAMEFELQVEDVDREKRRIVLKRPDGGVRNAEGRPVESTRSVCIREFKKALAKGEQPLVIGRVTEVFDEFAFVDVFDEGIAATIGRAKWRKGYVESLKTVIRPGEYCRFYVREVTKDDRGKTLIYLSHRGLEDDDWNKINWDYVEEGGSVVVECVQKPAGKNYFWGASDRFPGNPITCEYTSKFRKGSKNVVVGIHYDCKIKRIEPGDENNKRCIVVTPFRVYEPDMVLLANAKGVGEEPLSFNPFDSSKKKEGEKETPGGSDE
ncbi:MAG: hypothetical protein IKO41_07815 [Lachnospiraceae bacterium]|nr:hypothetical protein [Lachnospiraceae bacterium]